MFFRAVPSCIGQDAIAGAVFTAVFLLAAVPSTPALATDGYLENGYGARQKALGGAGVASSTDATAASLNPAGLVNVGNQIDVAISFRNLHGGYDSAGLGGVTADGSHDSDKDWNVIPNLAASWRVNLGLADVVALTYYTNDGINTRYGNIANANCPPGMTGVFCGGPLGVKFEQSFFSVAFAKEVLPGISVGVAPIVARQTIRVDGVALYGGFSSDPANFSDQGTSESWGAGVRGGLEWKIAPGVRFGVAGNAPIHMSRFDEYRGLFAEQGKADIPATVQAGIAVDLLSNVTLMVDYKHIWFGSVAAFANPSTNLALFGSNGGPGFGLQDLDVLKLGVEWRRSADLTLRAGYSYNTAPITSRDPDLNIMTLLTTQHHITGGLKYRLTDNLDLELGAMYAPNASVSGLELGNPLRTADIGVSQFEFTIGAVYRFGERRPLEPLK